MGWFTSGKTWLESGSDPDDKNSQAKHEINISAQALELKDDWTIEDLVAVLVHECVHYFCSTNGIKDVSGRVHNKHFKEEAEKVGLIVSKDKSVGWGITSPNDTLKNWIKDEVKPDKKKLMYFRHEVLKPAKEKEHKTKYKYTCSCGKKFTLKNEYNLVCGE